VITPTRARIVVTEGTRPTLPKHVRLHFDEVRQGNVIMAPEKLYWPDEIGMAILTRCNGERGVAQIASELADEYEAPRDIILNDVLEFVQEWSDKLLLKS
jgi:pyrroloquinoline quinone biosynthesis protein D